MIYLEMNGRLGNQMFRYAFARMLQLQGGEEETICMDFSNIFAEQKKGEIEGWEDSLRHFQVVPYTYYNKKGKLLWNETSLWEKAVLALILGGDRLLVRDRDPRKRLNWRRHFLKWQNRHGIYQLFIGYDYPFTWVKKKRKIAAAPFECARYCESIRETLQKEFTPKYPVPERNRELMEKIQGTNSVCITIRRGNFLQYKMLDVCTVKYFEDAVRKMKELVENPVFFVFSDDVQWARENLSIEGEVFYESGSDPVWEKLRLMYSCRHFIISNSTFSWWAQFLGRYPGKQVIAPDHWYNGTYQPPLYEEGWHLMKV